jgi:hypothetical protein
MRESFPSSFTIAHRQKKKKRVDNRTRRDRQENRNKDFREQMSALTDSYMAWDMHRTGGVEPTPEQDSCGSYAIRIVDLCSKHPHPYTA